MKLLLLVTSIACATYASEQSVITFPKPSLHHDINWENEYVQRTHEYGTTQNVAYYVANLGLKIVRDLLTRQHNVIISPINIYSCLGILSIGAGGKTRNEIENVLGPRIFNESINNYITAPDGVSFASALFLNYEFEPKADFLNSVAEYYQASVLNINASNGEESKKLINDWVSDNTNGTIKNLLRNNVDPATKMIAVSALTFKGKWLQSFSPAATTVGKFKVDEGFSVDVQLMNLVATVPVVRSPQLDAIGLPYQQPGIKMYLILPKEPGVTNLKKLLSHLNVNSLKKLKRESVNEEILIIIPKVNIDGRYSLVKPLQELGISSMFNYAQANFKNLAENDSSLFLSEVHHSVHLEMNEEGTIASAATAGVLTKSSKFVFRATRPFIVVITTDDDLILFMGAIANPLKT